MNEWMIFLNPHRQLYTFLLFRQRNQSTKQPTGVSSSFIVIVGYVCVYPPAARHYFAGWCCSWQAGGVVGGYAPVVMFLHVCRVIWGTNIDGKTSVWHWEVGASLNSFPYVLPLCKFQHSIFHNYTAAIKSVSFEKTKVWYLTYLVGSHSVVDDFYRKTTQEIDIQELEVNLFCLQTLLESQF